MRIDFAFFNAFKKADFFRINAKSVPLLAPSSKYLSDSSAISHKTAEVLSDRKFYVEEYKKEMSVVPKTDIEKVNQGASLQALKELLKKQYFLISFSHHRNYDPEDFIRFVKKNGVDWDKMEQFCKKYGLDVKCYPIY